MSRTAKTILIYVAVVLALIITENICIDIFVAKTFTTDMFGFREFLVQLFQIGKMFVNGATAYFAYCVYKMFN